MADLVAEIAVSEARFRQQTRKVFDDALRATEDFERQANAKLKDFGKGFANTEMTKAQAREFDRLKRQFDPLYAASKRYEGQLAQLNQAQKMGALSTKQYEAALERLNAEFAVAPAAAENVSRMGGRMGAQLQQVGFQIGDFATQVGAGTSATQALGQQLPQLLGAFGTFGALAGAAAAIMIPLGSAIVRTALDSESLEDSMKGLEEATDAMADAAEMAARPLSELRDLYGDLADEVQRSQSALAGFAAEVARRNLGTAAGQAGRGLFGGGIDPATVRDMSGMSGLSATDQVGLAIRKMAADLKISGEEAREFNRTLLELGKNPGPQEVVTITDKLLAVLTASPEVAEKFGAEIAVLGNLSAEAARQIEAQRLGVERLLDTYDKTTRELARQKEDLKRAEDERAKAVAAGLSAEVRQWDRVIDKIREAIRETRAAGAEADSVFERMANAAESVMGRAGKFLQGAIAPGMDAISLIKDFEGFREKPYWDVNAYRAGFGSDTVTLSDGSVQKVTQGMRVSLEDANRDLARRIVEFQRGIVSDIGQNRWDRFTTEQQAALTSIAYNYGSLPDRIIAAVKGGTSQDIATAIGRLAGDNEGVNESRRFREASAFGSTTAAAGELRDEARVASETARALEAENRERERKAELVRQYGEQIAATLVTEQQRAELERQRSEAIAAITASDLSGADKAAAIAEVNGEMQKQLTIMALLEEANRRGVDLNAQMVNSTITYAQAIEALGEAKKRQVITDQQVQASAAKAAEAQQFWNDQQRALKDGLIDAIIAGESFADVLANVAQALAKAALQAALFGEGPLASGGGGLWGAILGSLGGGVRGNDVLSQALRGAMSFDGGGFTGIGVRSGGLDGKGGFPAILHPNETVVDHTRGQRVGANVTYSPSLNIAGDASERTVALIEGALERERAAFFSRWTRAQREYSTRIA